MPQHYALVSKPGCGPLKVARPLAVSAASPSSDHRHGHDHGRRPRSRTRRGKDVARSGGSDGDVRRELESIYQTYADMYPNPKLMEERRQRDTLLQAAVAASTFQKQQQQQQQQQHGKDGDSRNKKKTKTGLFSFLFGGGKSKSTNDAEGEQGVDTGPLVNIDDSNDDEDDVLVYSDTPNPLDDGSLCGTLHSIDASCVPSEVYSVARSHLTSTRTRRDHPNALRGGPRQPRHGGAQCSNAGRSTTDDAPNSASPADSLIYIVAGLGEIAEFGGGGGNRGPGCDERGLRSTSRILYTSDRDELVAYARRSQQEDFQVHNVRGTVLSEHCIAVSWGFMDGIVVLYRRICFPGKGGVDGWEAVWMVGPSGPVLKNMTGGAQDLFHDDEEQPGSPLLRVSDCVALHVESPPPLDPDTGVAADEMSAHQQSLVATLAVSRLGGYIELIPLPTGLWSGPLLTPNNYRRKRPQKRKRGDNQQHYATGQKIACPPQTLAITTLDYHVDVQCLEVYRTSVSGETVWNNQDFPDSPPAEFVLVASGVSVDGDESMTFWTVSILFPETPNPQDEIGFQLDSNLIEVVAINTGAPVSTFATQGILSRWRTPRNVELKDAVAQRNGSDHPGDREGCDASDLASRGELPRVTTLSTTSPIVAMRFSDSDGSTSTHSGPFLSILDWNGGVQILDCSVMGRLAAQSMPLHEYEHYRDATQQQQDPQQQQHQPPLPLTRAIVQRNQFASALIDVGHTAVSNLHWLSSASFGLDGTLPSVVLLLSKCRMLAVATFAIPLESEPSDGTTHQSPKSSTIALPFPATGATMKILNEDNLAFVSLQRGRGKSSQHSFELLKYFVMEQLQPVDIVKTLARESKFEEAIQSATKLSGYEQTELADVLTLCHRRLWELDNSIDSLATQEPGFIMSEAMSICRAGTGNNDGFSWEKVHSVLKLGLETSEKVGDDEKAVIMRQLSVRLGTYELLCQLYGSNPQLRQFRNEYWDVDTFALSVHLAQRADIGALSIVLFRHRCEVRPKTLSILGALPLALSPFSYSHLLPVLQGGVYSDFFLQTNYDGQSNLLPWPHMPQFLIETEEVPIVIDRFDERVVLDYNASRHGDSIHCDSQIGKAAATWFTERAKQIHKFVGKADDAISLCDLGLKCLAPNMNESNFSTFPPATQNLYRTWQASLSLQKLLLDEVASIDADFIGIENLMEMSLAELLDLVLDGETDSSVILGRFRDYLRPLILESSSGTDDASPDLDQALMSYCINEAKKCKGATETGQSVFFTAKQALASTAAIAESSRASIHKRDRLIKRIELLIEMVLAVTNEVASCVDELDLSMDEERELVDLLWTMYESLPARFAPTTPLDTSQIEDNLQKLEQDLVGVDILSRWPGSRPFVFYNSRQKIRGQAGKEDPCNDQGVVIDICRIFNEAIKNIESNEIKTAFLHDLLYDLKTINKSCFGNRVDIYTILNLHMVPDQLGQGNYEVVAEYVRANEALIKKEVIERSILDFMDDAVFAENSDGGQIILAMKCQDTLGNIFPEIAISFRTFRRFLDASHFVTNVIFAGGNARPLSPSDLRRMTPLDTIESVLKSVPESVVCGSPQWMDVEYGRTANLSLRRTRELTGQAIEESHLDHIPVLPGGAIFHLATILGLEDSLSALAVKCRVIHYALVCEFHGVAAAIARSLIYEADFGPNATDAIEISKLGAIAEIATIENYADVSTKKELCDAALSRFKGRLSASNCAAFDIILQVSSSLNQYTSRFNQAFDDFPTGRKEALLSRPVSRLHKHILHEYNTDLHHLFLNLKCQADDNTVHDSLLNSLSRFVLYWCIHDSKSLKPLINSWDKADAHANLALGLGLILQIPSTLTASNCAHELQKIATDQAANVANEERFGTLPCTPDLLIVQKLVGRGYTENAARRAAIMTGNVGYNDALGWAVMHTMDPDFNQPVAVVKLNGRMYIDDDSIRFLEVGLSQIYQVLEDPRSRAKFLRYIATHDGDEVDDPPISQVNPFPARQIGSVANSHTADKDDPTPQIREAGIATNGKVNFESRESMQESNSKTAGLSLKEARKPGSLRPFPSAIATQRPVRSSDVVAKPTPSIATQSAKHIEKHPEAPVLSHNGNTAALSPSPKQLGIAKLQGAKPRSVVPPETSAQMLSGPGELPPHFPPSKPSGDVPFPPTSSRAKGKHTTEATAPIGNGPSNAADKTALDRDELRKRGQAALEKLRNTEADSNSRRRLIEEGRQLLQKSRSSTKLPRVTAAVAPPAVVSSEMQSSRSDPCPPPRQRLEIEKSNMVNNSSTASSSRLSPRVTEGQNSQTSIRSVVKPINTSENGNGEGEGWDFEDFDNM